MDTDDREQTLRLVEQAQRGERQALEALFARHRDKLLPLVRARLGPMLRAHVDSQDVRDSQRKDGHRRGSWDPNDPWGHAGGRVYSTALMAPCLEVHLQDAPR